MSERRLPRPSARPRTTLLVGALALVATGCSAPSVELTPRVLFLELEGDFAADRTQGDLSASQETSWDRLGLDDSVTAISPRADVHVGPIDWTFDYAAADFSGTGTTSAEIELDGTTIAQGATVESELDLAVWRAIGTWDFVPTDFATVGVGLGLAAVDFDAAIVDPNAAASISADETVPLPFVALRGGLDWGDLDAEALLGVLAIDFDSYEASYVDLDLFVRYHVFGGANRASIHVLLGYRFVELDAEYEDGSDRVAFDTSLSGPYLGATIGF